MFTLAVLDSDAFCRKGIADYFNDRDIRTLCCPDVAELEYIMKNNDIQVVIAELATRNDTIFSCVKYLTRLSQRRPNIRLIIFTHINDTVMINYVLRHVPYSNIVMKNESLTRLSFCIFQALESVLFSAPRRPRS